MSRTRRPLGRGETGTRTLSRDDRRKVKTGLRGEGVEPQRTRAGGRLQPTLGEFCSPWGKILSGSSIPQMGKDGGRELKAER